MNKFSFYSIDAPHMCVGLEFKNDVCVNAPPIIKWALGKGRKEIAAYCKRKGWQMALVSLRMVEHE